MTLALEQRLAVNPFGNKIIVIDRKPEAVQNVETTLDEAVENAIKHYEQTVQSNKWDSTGIKILSPMQIQATLSEMLKKHVPSAEDIWGVRAYLSRIIQKSYEAGNNNFILAASDSQLIIMGLKGTKQNPIHATVIGNAGDKFGNSSSYCTFDVQGDVQDNCGTYSQYCTYNICGNAKNDCGDNSKYSIFNINGNVRVDCGSMSYGSNYIIHGDAGATCGSLSQKCNYKIKGDAENNLGDHSKNCTYTIKGNAKSAGLFAQTSIFKLFSEKTYGLFIHGLPLTNEVLLLDSAGSIIRKWVK